MTCTQQITALVECARIGSPPGRDLRAHLAACARCAERWEAERQLTDEFRTARLRAAALTALDTEREVLMQEFAALDIAGQRRRMVVRRWSLALGAAAAVFVSILAGHAAAARMYQAHLPATRAHGTRNARTVIYEAGFYEPSADASALTGDDFIAVPYTPPLAQGELVRVVHADLYPEALASMGIDVDPAGASEIPADVVVGEDGIPRAVRITENAQ